VTPPPTNALEVELDDNSKPEFGVPDVEVLYVGLSPTALVAATLK
jgi:hypothetical protein